MKRAYLIALMCLFFLSACNGRAADDYRKLRYTHELSETTFAAFAGKPLSEKYGNVRAVKVMYDLSRQKLYFINSAFFKYHHEFAAESLNDWSSLLEFNDANYSDGHRRRFFLGNLNYYPAIGRYLLELSASDEMGVENICRFYELVRESSKLDHEIGFLLNSNRLMNLKKELSEKLPVTDPAELYKNLRFQSIAAYSAMGILRIEPDISEGMRPVEANEILVLGVTPIELPAVRGLIVSEFQTPLSHVSILGQNRKIPICALRNALHDSTLLRLEGKKVRLTVRDTNFMISEVSELDDPGQNKPVISLEKDLSLRELIDCSELDMKDSDKVGNKAANFGELCKLSGPKHFKTPEVSFAIPFWFYEEHMRRCGADSLIEQLIASHNRHTAAQTAETLKEIRKRIRKTAVDPALIRTIDRKLRAQTEFRTFRFRSSTNAEDAEGFSGAGLYTSKTVDLDDPERGIEEALQKVWASLWYDAAFTERVIFNMDQQNVSMGVLVHRSFPDEAVNGVAITKNLYRNDYPGYVINAQLGDVSVVSPENDIVCDQFVCYPAQTDEFYNNTVDVITYSDLNGGQLVMTPEEIKYLSLELERLKRYFARKYRNYSSFNEFALDIEFKLGKGDRQLYIKQVRLYNN